MRLRDDVRPGRVGVLEPALQPKRVRQPVEHGCARDERGRTSEELAS